MLLGSIFDTHVHSKSLVSYLYWLSVTRKRQCRRTAKVNKHCTIAHSYTKTNAFIHESVFFAHIHITLLQTKMKPATAPKHEKHDVLVKDARQQLNASMDVIFRVLDDIGVSTAT